MNIVVSTCEPESPEPGMLWVNPDANYPCCATAAELRPRCKCCDKPLGECDTNVLVPPSACLSAPVMCQVFTELFGRMPDEVAANAWLNVVQTQGLKLDRIVDLYKLRGMMMRSAGASDCAHIGGTYDAVNQVCIIA
jgi:hypothetical protein